MELEASLFLRRVNLSEAIANRAVASVSYPFISPYPEHACLTKFRYLFYRSFYYNIITAFGWFHRLVCSDGVYEIGTSLDKEKTLHGVYVLWTNEGLWRSHEAPRGKAQWYIDRYIE